MSTLRLMLAGCILWLISIGAVIADSPEEISWRVDDAVLGTSAVSMSENSCFKLFRDSFEGCLFVDEGAIYVATTDAGAVDNGSCGLAPTATGLGHPCKTIGKGIARAVALARAKVLVASGQYVETVTVVDGVSLYGGYSAQTWQRSPDLFLTAITGDTASGHRVTVDATDIATTSTVIDGFTIYGQTATGIAENSYAVLVRRSNERLTLTHNAIWAGAGGPGDSGARGGDGTSGGGGSAGATAYEPRSGGVGYNCWETCNAAGISNPGGAGGTNGSCSSANGGKGGTADCPDFNESVNQCVASTTTSLQTQTTAGSNGQGASPGLRGKGGCDSLIDYVASGTCSSLRPSFDATNCPNGVFSAAGHDGTKGGAGTAGARCNSAGGQLLSGHWQGTAGGAGGTGVSGSGGGGGGAGGGVESYNDGSCSAYSDFGGSGGGGGAGGCGGGGGTAGTAGGGAFGVFVVFEANPGTSVPAIRDNTIHTGYGGVGGRGGEAGTPGVGGNGGFGGPAAAANSSDSRATPGSKGGEGGDGGPGGGGGGGCGGASYGLWIGGPYTPSNLSGWSNAITLDGGGGGGGPGGQTTAGGNNGQEGFAGTHGQKNF